MVSLLPDEIIKMEVINRPHLLAEIRGERNAGGASCSRVACSGIAVEGSDGGSGGYDLSSALRLKYLVRKQQYI